MLNLGAIEGRFTDTPELKTTPTGIPVTSFCIAVTAYGKNPDGTKKADYIDCVAWRDKAEFICKYFRKGKMIIIEGKYHTNSYTSEGGEYHKETILSVDDAHFSGEKVEPQQ